MIVGVGRPNPLWGLRMDAELANAMVMQDLSRYNFIALTVFAPYTVLLEGFRTELAFLFEGTLQARADLIEAAKLTFVKRRLTSKDIELKYKNYPPLPMEGLRSTACTQIIERLVRVRGVQAREVYLRFPRRVVGDRDQVQRRPTGLTIRRRCSISI